MTVLFLHAAPSFSLQKLLPIDCQEEGDFGQEIALPSVAGIQNKANFPFH